MIPPNQSPGREASTRSSSRRSADRTYSSASSTRFQSPSDCSRAKLRAAEKSFTQVNVLTAAPISLAISAVRSVDPVSVMKIPSTRGAAACRHFLRERSSFLTIITRFIFIMFNILFYLFVSTAFRSVSDRQISGYPLHHPATAPQTCIHNHSCSGMRSL